MEFLDPAFEVVSWLRPLVGALFAAAAAAVAGDMAFRILRRTTARGRVLPQVLARARAPLLLILPLLALNAIWELVPLDLPGLHAVRHATVAALILAGAWLLTRIVSAVAKAILITHPISRDDYVQTRRLHTETRVLARTVNVLIVVFAVGMVLMTFPTVQLAGTSLLASAGVAGIIAGLAARPVVGNLFAGLQIGLTQPIRQDDVVVVDGEWGTIEEITGAFVVVRLWDERRLIVPLQWWLENPFQNWTRQSTQLIGSVIFWVDYRMPIAPLRQQIEQIEYPQHLPVVRMEVRDS